MSAEIIRAEELKVRYLTEAIVTASPAIRLTMLYDRMVIDLHRADEGFGVGDLKMVSDNLCHTQEILLALRSTLRPDLWEGANSLGALYTFLHQELVLANLEKDRDRARKVADMIAELAQAWRQASQAVASSPTSPQAVSTAGMG